MNREQLWCQCPWCELKYIATIPADIVKKMQFTEEGYFENLCDSCFKQWTDNLR